MKVTHNMNQPNKLYSKEQIEEWASKRADDAGRLSRQLLDTMRENASAKNDIEMLYKSREEYIRENEHLHMAIDKAHTYLMNVQPKIEQHCYPNQAVFIDNYVDAAMELLQLNKESGLYRGDDKSLVEDGIIPIKQSETDFVCEGVRKYGKVIDTPFPELPEVYSAQNPESKKPIFAHHPMWKHLYDDDDSSKT